MNFSQSLDYLYGLRRFGIKLGLDNVRILLGRLGDPQEAFKCIHVAGTNGKGSVSNFLAAILRHDGRRVGLYTSPHLHCFTERINVSGEPISQELAAELVTELKAVASGVPVTFFEATTVLALMAFARLGVDYAVLETGLGGRLDATNVVQPEVCCITPISLDHQEHLGTTLAQIAGEKAGIIKPETPVVLGPQPQEALAVLQRVAKDLQAPTYLAGRDFRWEGDHDHWCFDGFGREITGLACAQPGSYQLANFSLAIAVTLLLREKGLQVEEAAISKTGQLVSWPGRLEWWPQHNLLLDAAHNPAGILSLVDYLGQQGIDRVHLLAGLSGGRRPESVLSPLSGHIRELYAVPVPEETTVPASVTKCWADGEGISCREFDSPRNGLLAALSGCSSREPLVVCGSLFLVAAVREILMASDDEPLPAQSA